MGELLWEPKSFILGKLRQSGFRLKACAPVAQLDRATGYEPVGRRFDSFRAHHKIKDLHEAKIGIWHQKGLDLLQDPEVFPADATLQAEVAVKANASPEAFLGRGDCLCPLC